MDHGLTFDLTPMDHMSESVSQGKQLMKIEGREVPLIYDRRKMFVNIRKPSEEEIDNLEVYELTSPEPFNPEEYGIESPGDIIHRRKSFTHKEEQCPGGYSLEKWKRCLGLAPEDVIRNGIGKYFKLIEGSIGEPKMYLGNKISKVKLQNGIEAWSLSSARYVHETVKNVEDHLQKINSKLPTRASAPFPTNCRPELDTSEELDAEGQTYYQSLIGVLRWIIELGRIDIGAEASIMIFSSESKSWTS